MFFSRFSSVIVVCRFRLVETKVLGFFGALTMGAKVSHTNTESLRMGINRKKIFLRTSNGNAATYIYINGMNHYFDACPKPRPRFPMTYVVIFFMPPG